MKKTAATKQAKVAELRAQWIAALDAGDGDRMFWLTREINRLEAEV